MKLSAAQQKLLEHLVDSGRHMAIGGLTHHQRQTILALERRGLVARMRYGPGGNAFFVPPSHKGYDFWGPTAAGRALVARYKGTVS